MDAMFTVFSEAGYKVQREATLLAFDLHMPLACTCQIDSLTVLDPSSKKS